MAVTHRSTLRILTAALAAAAAAAAVPSCGTVQIKGMDEEASSGEGNGAVRPEVEDPFAPVELRIHPLTRTVEAEAAGQVVIEAYFELVDQWGHTTKALGQLQVELTRGDDGGGDRSVRWRVDLRDPEENSTQRFDEATRTYRLRLVDAPADLAGASDAELRASFTSVSGTRLTASRRLRRESR